MVVQNSYDGSVDDVFECARGIAQAVYNPFSAVYGLNEELLEVDKKVKHWLFPINVTNPEYVKAETNLNDAINRFNDSQHGKVAVGKFNETSGREIKLLGEAIEVPSKVLMHKTYKCKIMNPRDDVKIVGEIDISPPDASIEVIFKGCVDVKPSTIVDAFKDLRGIGISFYEITQERRRSMAYEPPSSDTVNPAKFAKAKLIKMIDGDNRFRIHLAGLSCDSEFFSALEFAPGEEPEINIDYAEKEILTKNPKKVARQKNWLKETVRILTGSGLNLQTKPVEN